MHYMTQKIFHLMIFAEYILFMLHGSHGSVIQSNMWCDITRSLVQCTGFILSKMLDCSSLFFNPS